eukprot:XP_001692098.1 trehalose-6-phosphate synthase/phosphatase [Chlamydomonas reinhardtii]
MERVVSGLDPDAIPSDENVSSSLPTTRVGPAADRLLRERIRRNRSHQAFDVYEDPPPEDPVLETVPEPPLAARLVVVANRLPVTCSKDVPQSSAGGLVSALKGVSNYVTLWIGWPGIWVKAGRERDELTAMLKSEHQIMLGVDRLDMVKGIPQKLLAYEKFLEEHPEWRDKVLLVQIAVPSRTDVPEYQKLRSMVHEIVGRINGQYGTLTYVPIYHLDTSLSFTELCALYAVTDVALVTSLRDGMNLVSYEYVACQSDNAGVLVLSEFAGAAQSLGAGALLVNPWNISDMATAIYDALSMSEDERRERHRQNYMHVQTHTAQHWADTFITELNDTHIEADLRMRHTPPPQVKALAKVNPRVMQSVCELCTDPNNVVVIFSGSETSKLDEVFGHLPVWLAAENGVYPRPPLPQWKCVFDQVHCEWMESVQLVFDYFCERTPRSFVEARETSLVWNYKYADVEFGRIQARDLLQHLWTGPISNAPVEIIQGGKSVEVRPVGVTKGLAMQRLVGIIATEGGIEAAAFDMVLCIGHLLGRDENLFSLFEGARIDGAAPAHNSRAAAAAAAASLQASHTRSSSTGGINLSTVLEVPPGTAAAAAAGGGSGSAQRHAALAAAAAAGGSKVRPGHQCGGGRPAGGHCAAGGAPAQLQSGGAARLRSHRHCQRGGRLPAALARARVRLHTPATTAATTAAATATTAAVPAATRPSAPRLLLQPPAALHRRRRQRRGRRRLGGVAPPPALAAVAPAPAPPPPSQPQPPEQH